MKRKSVWRVTIKANIGTDNPKILEKLILCRMRLDETGEEIISAMDDNFEVIDYPDDWLDFKEVIKQMKKSEIKKLIRRQEHLITRLTDDQEECLDMLEEFYNISVKLNKQGDQK